jgi:RNA ligase
MISIDQLSAYKAAKLLRCQKHPNKDLYIWNYSELAQCKQQWDEVTTVARALVTDGTGNVIARSFKKFHNIEEGRHKPTADFVVEEKLDGSLIIAFWHEDEWIVASRGSFVSSQADHARTLLAPRFADMNKQLAYSFEVIYPENRIVVDYGRRDDIILLAAYDTLGREHVDAMIPGVTKVATFHFTDYKSIKELNWANSEGFVARFSNGERVKIKFQSYLELHRIVTNINCQTVWELFCKNPEVIDGLNDIPDEFMQWVEEKWHDLSKQYNELTTSITEAYHHFKTATTSRAEFAKLAAKHKHAKMLFALYDNKPDHVNKIILDMIRPINGSLDTPFTGVGSTGTLKSAPTTMPTLTVLIGASGAGKTTWCREYLRQNPQAVRVSRDAIRSQLFAESPREYYAHNNVVLQAREEMVSAVLVATIHAALDKGANVVIDNTHLEKRYIDKYVKEFPYCRICLKAFSTSLEECITNDAKRSEDERVGVDKIQMQYTKFKTILKYIATKQYIEPHKLDPIKAAEDLPEGYIFDIDGTLADNSHRSPYNWHAVDKDGIIADVRDALLSIQEAGYKIAICTGRDAVAETKTREWLALHGITYDWFYIRPHGNREPDWIIKERMWRDVATKMRIKAMFDDRDCVVRHARKLGLRVYQVAEGAF